LQLVFRILADTVGVVLNRGRSAQGGGGVAVGGPGRPRLADIARAAKVSEATVSRVLNGKPGVRGPKRETVLTALDALGYQRPERLRKQIPGLVGLIVPELDNPIFPMFVQRMQVALAERGFTAVLGTQPFGGTTESEYIDILLDSQVAGIVVVSGRAADTMSGADQYSALTVPIALVNGYLPDVAAPFVSCDDRAAAELAVRHLAGLGHRRIGLLTGPARFLPVQRKLDGYRQTMTELFGGVDEDAIELSLFGVEGGCAAAERLLNHGCTGLVCGSDLMALGAIRAARTRGLDVPVDVSVVGYDDSALMAFTDPPLTTLRQPVAAMSVAAVQALTDAINGDPAPHSEYLFRPELIVRASTAIPRE
jgi:alanine racemase